jgi:poly(3-hydroxyalkanoate) synthetase
LSSASQPWKNNFDGLAKALAANITSPEHFTDTTKAYGLDRTKALIEGIHIYLSEETPIAPKPPSVVWQKGNTQLLDYGSLKERKSDAPVVVAVPSLINRAYILDLFPERSLMRFLASQGTHPFLLDWNTPDDEEAGFSFDDYLEQRLIPALEMLRTELERPVTLLGYCMGGLMALSVAQARPDLVERLALLATPWDFHSKDVAHIPLSSGAEAALENAFAGNDIVPAAVLHGMFYYLNPWSVHNKFRRIARNDLPAIDHQALLAREYWVNDGVPLSPKVGRTCFVEWAAQNQPAKGTWHSLGHVVAPEKIDKPTFIAMPEYDQVVPPLCAKALADLMPMAEKITTPTGHVGMIVNAQAEKHLWKPLAKWLLKR